MRRAVVVLALSTVVPASAATLTGCGSSDPKPPDGTPNTISAPQQPAAPGALVAASYSKITEARSARLDLNFQLTAGSPGGPGSTDIKFGGSGVQDFVAKKAQITIQDPTGQPVEERVVGTTIYVKLPPAAQSSPALKGKSWLKTDLDKAAQSAGLGNQRRRREQ